MEDSISENKLAKKLGIKPARLRLWRNEFLKVGVKSDPNKRGTSLKLTRDDVFTIMLAAEIIRHGGSRISAGDQIQRISFNSTTSYLYRKVSWVSGSDQSRVTTWTISPKPPDIDESEDLSFVVININTIRAKVDKILG